MHSPPCLVSLCLIIALRPGCTPSHPGIERRDPPPAFHRLLLIPPLLDCQPPLFSPKLFQIDSCRFLSSSGHSWPSCKLSHSFELSGPSLFTMLPLFFISAPTLTKPIIRVLASPASLGRQSCGKWSEGSISTLIYPQDGLLASTTVNSSSARGIDFEY